MEKEKPMKFIEMTGQTLAAIVSDRELPSDGLGDAGVGDNSIVRINQHGDIEVRKANKWSIIGGLLGQFEVRVKEKTGFDWV